MYAGSEQQLLFTTLSKQVPLTINFQLFKLHGSLHHVCVSKESAFQRNSKKESELLPLCDPSHI